MSRTCHQRGSGSCVTPAVPCSGWTGAVSCSFLRGIASRQPLVDRVGEVIEVVVVEVPIDVQGHGCRGVAELPLDRLDREPVSGASDRSRNAWVRGSIPSPAPTKTLMCQGFPAVDTSRAITQADSRSAMLSGDTARAIAPRSGVQRGRWPGCGEIHPAVDGPTFSFRFDGVRFRRRVQPWPCGEAGHHVERPRVLRPGVVPRSEDSRCLTERSRSCHDGAGG